MNVGVSRSGVWEEVAGLSLEHVEEEEQGMGLGQGRSERGKMREGGSAREG